MDNSVVLYTVSYGIFIFFRRIYRTYIRVSVFLHFTEIYFPNETKISLPYNFQKSPFFVVLLLKIAVFRNDFGKIRNFRTVYDALLFIRQLMTHLLYDALLYLTHCRFLVQYISRILDFLCKIYIICGYFY